MTRLTYMKKQSAKRPQNSLPYYDQMVGDGDPSNVSYFQPSDQRLTNSQAPEVNVSTTTFVNKTEV